MSLQAGVSLMTSVLPDTTLTDRIPLPADEPFGTGGAIATRVWWTSEQENLHKCV